jgi:fatty-acyl-CoA synthase
VFTDKRMPQTTLKNAVAYEDWIAEVDGDFKWKTFDENTAAAMCYTSGTTGDPKGVLYSHRSNVLHALMANSGDSLGANAADTMLPVVPLFHANSWGIAFSRPRWAPTGDAGPSSTARLGLLRHREGHHTAGVPTVWLMLLKHGRRQPEAAPPAHGGVRRLGDAALDDQVVPRHGRRPSRLGHDRDEPDRHARPLKPPFDR